MSADLTIAIASKSERHLELSLRTIVARFLMALVHAKGMDLSVPRNNTINAAIPALPKTNSTILGTSAVTKARKPSRFGRLLNRIPGYTWVKDKIGRFIHGPTYGMTDSELQEYKISQDRQTRIASLKKEREAEFKVAKYMAHFHPDFYWHKYVYRFERGSEERKRGVFLFALVNMEEYGNYYGPRWLYKVMLETEFKEMGISLEGQNIVKEYTEGRNATKIVRFRRRDTTRETDLKIPEDDQKVYDKLRKIVHRIDISHLIVQNKMKVPRGTRRAFKISDAETATHAKFD